MRTLILIFVILIAFVDSILQAQRWPNDDAGDPAAERLGYMEGNRVRVLFRNNTELSDWGFATDPSAHKWPNDYTGSKMTDGIAFMVGARVFVKDKSVPVTDPSEIKNRKDLDTLAFCQTAYREGMEYDPSYQVSWGFHPVRGYVNDAQWDSPALLRRPDTWPLGGWPIVGSQKKYAGQWFGRQAAGKNNADEECFFVVNDAQDQEYLTNESPVKYFPRPGHFIGEIDPQMSVQKGMPWGGVGLRVAVRGYQWADYLARDIIFWEYNIGNISDYDIPETAVGFWVDSGIGGNDGNDDMVSTDGISMIYVWDVNGIGDYGLKVGSMGFILLETPSISGDGKDNDSDGIVDEKRNNQAVKIVGPKDGIADLGKFLEYYNLKESNLRNHWDADEDQDWKDGLDENQNGKYDVGEFAGDDIGLDGIAPGEWNYPGPDPDGSECNHRPDYQPGVGCEPNFAALDVNESDMLGLTSVRQFPVPQHFPPFRYWFRNDASMWELLGVPEISLDNRIGNYILTFASGPFRLNRNDEAWLSYAEAHSFDPIEGIRKTPVEAPDLHFQKMVAQSIMNADYHLVLQRPANPAIPTITIQQLGRSVKISWDDNAEKNSREPLLKNQNDFEGYKLYKQFCLNDKLDQWSEKQLLMQCDKIDGIKGYFEYVTPKYYLGDDTGLLHEYVDSEISEGETYRYELVAYDYGISPNDPRSSNPYNIPFPPFESSDYRVISIPYPPSVNFPWTKLNEHFIGSGTVIPEVTNRKAILSRHTYLVKFLNQKIRSLKNCEIAFSYVANGLQVYDITDGNKVLVYQDTGNQAGSIISLFDYFFGIPAGTELLTDSFHGMRLKIYSEVLMPEYDRVNSGWLKGDKPIAIALTLEDSKVFPWDCEIVFTDNPAVFQSEFAIKASTRIKDENDTRINNAALLGKQLFSFYVRNTTFGNSFNNKPIKIEMVVQDMNGDGKFSMIDDRVLVGYLDNGGGWAGTAFVIDFPGQTTADLPSPGDIYRIKFKRPFFENDSLVFIIDPEGTWVDNLAEIPLKTRLNENYPNPFNPYTTISYSIAEPQQVELKIFNIIGQHIATLVNSRQEPGNYEILFNGECLPSGVYFYTLQAGKVFEKRKMLIVR